MKRFITLFIAIVVMCVTMTANPKGKCFIVATPIEYSHTVDFDSTKIKKLPQYTKLMVVQGGNIFTRVRVVYCEKNRDIEGKFIFVRTHHLNNFCNKIY